MEKIPVTITVSRETGKVVEVECGNVTEETFRKVCQELMKIGKEDGNGKLSGGTCSGNTAGNLGNPDGHGQDRRVDREKEA